MKTNKLIAVALGIIALMVAVLGGDWTMCVIAAPVVGILMFTKFDYAGLQYGDPRLRR